MKWIRFLDKPDIPAKELIGGKAWSIASMGALGFSVPPAFAVTTEAHAEFARSETMPEGLTDELFESIAWLEAKTGKSFGRGPRPLLVSVRSGAAVSMPGMMDTVLNLGVTDNVEQALADESCDPDFARDTHCRFLQLYTSIVGKTELPSLSREAMPAQWREAFRDATGKELSQDPIQHLVEATIAVFKSWNSRRAVRYRNQQGISHELGTAVTIQAMVFGNLDNQSGTGVLFSRNPVTGGPIPFGEYLCRAQGEDIVSGAFTPQPLSSMKSTVPEALQQLLDAAKILEKQSGEVQDIEFTVERGRLFLLQTRAAKLAPVAGVRTAVQMVAEQLIDDLTAIRRVTPDRARILLAPTLLQNAEVEKLEVAKGEGACPGVGIGKVVTDSDIAEQCAAAGETVVLARPTTSPHDLHGMIASAAIITEEGGSTSHAAVVSRALGKPCVVGCGDGRLQSLTGTVVTVDGRTGRIYAGPQELIVPDEEEDEALATLVRWAQRYTPLRVLRPSEAPDAEVLDLNQIEGGSDSAKIGEILIRSPGCKGARGGAIASDEGVRAAITAGLEFVVADPILPPLLAAVQSGVDMETRSFAADN